MSHLFLTPGGLDEFVLKWGSFLGAFVKFWGHFEDGRYNHFSQESARSNGAVTLVFHLKGFCFRKYPQIHRCWMRCNPQPCDRLGLEWRLLASWRCSMSQLDGLRTQICWEMPGVGIQNTPLVARLSFELAESNDSGRVICLCIVFLAVESYLCEMLQNLTVFIKEIRFETPKRPYDDSSSVGNAYDEWARDGVWIWVMSNAGMSSQWIDRQDDLFQGLGALLGRAHPYGWRAMLCPSQLLYDKFKQKCKCHLLFVIWRLLYPYGHSKRL